MNKRIAAFATGTAAVLAVAIGWQAFGASNGDEGKDQHPPVASTETPSTNPADGSDPTPPDGSTESPADETTDKTEEGDGGERDGVTEDHTGKPGENKD